MKRLVNNYLKHEHLFAVHLFNNGCVRIRSWVAKVIRPPDTTTTERDMSVVVTALDER